MMILRLVGLMLGGALAYLLLRGWPDWLPNFLGACLAVLVLVLALGWWAIGGPRSSEKGDALPDATSPRKPNWLDFVSIGMGLLAVECAFLWVLSVAPDPLEQLAVRIEQRFRPEAAEERARAGEVTQVSGNWLWQDEGERKLPARTNLKPGPKPEVFVRLVDAKDAERLLERQVYVRAFVMNQFADGAWSPGEADVETRQANQDGWIRFAAKAEREILHEVFLGENGGEKQAFAALQGARGVRLPSLQIVSEGIAYLPNMNEEDGYLASSVPLHLADLSPEMRLVQVSEPSSASDRMDRLARRVGGEGLLQEKLRRIESYLKSNYDYSLKTENRRDLDPLENFLFEEKRGHCEFFATAGAVMARSLGAEVRMAYGWASGEFFEVGNTFVFRARDAHAWVEVKVAGNDVWAVMDPTPPIAFGGAERPEIAEANEKMPDSEEVLEEEEAVSFGSGGGDFSTMFLILTGVFGCVAGVVFLVKARVHRPGGVGIDQFSVRGRGDPSYLADWHRALKEHGISSPQGLTLMSQVKSMEAAPDFAEDLLAYHYAVKYEQREPNPRMEREFRRKIKAWEAHDSL